MAFVDGENLAIQAKAVLSAASIDPTPLTDCWITDVFAWPPGTHGRTWWASPGITLESHSVRSHFYTSSPGAESKLQTTRELIWKRGFHPEVFHKPEKTRKSKGVDITLSKDMLVHAFQGTFDVAVLVAGDADYVPLVREVKRFGRRVVVAFFQNAPGMSEALRLESDVFQDITAFFTSNYTHKLQQLAEEAARQKTSR